MRIGMPPLPSVRVTRETSTLKDFGQKTVGTTAVQITTISEQNFGITVKADDDNTGNIFIGDSGVSTTTGFRLKAGQGITVELNNPSALYAIADAADQKIHYMVV